MNEVCGDGESVRRHVQAAGWRRIGIDGVDGESNAHLARALARTLHCPVLDVDDYLHRNQGGYVDFIDYPALAGALSSIPAFILSELRTAFQMGFLVCVMWSSDPARLDKVSEKS